ncbi:cytochrome P450 [Leptodontidium sp. 2 PMI_412]|nr:cytochrome P450 [Leptodontidium sp. 2 PMI_412]
MGVSITSATTGVRIVDGILFVLSMIVGVLGATTTFTHCRYWLQSRGNAGRFQGREPLTLPYSIPWLGGFARMIDPHGMYAYARKMSPQNRPVRLRVGPVGIYILFGDKNIKMIFRNSKKLSKDASSQMLFRNSGMEAHDMAILAHDTSGTGAVPLTDVPEEKRIWKKTHATGNAHLASGPSVNVLTNKFTERFIQELNKEPKDKTLTVPLYEFFRRVMATGSMTSVIGTEMYKLNPDFNDIYWDYDNAFLLMAIGMPKFLYWKGHSARNRMLAATKKWIKSAWKNTDKESAELDWEPHFGSRFIRQLAANLDNVGISEDGQASALLPMIWAINSNAIPCAVWIIFECIQRPGLIDRLREEVSASAITDQNGELTIDVPNLIAQSPLLTSIYLECLRVRSSNTITRMLIEDMECDGYVLKKGSHIMSPSWLPSHGPLWDVDGHPANEFWPERFIEMPKIKPSDPEEKTQFELAMKPDQFFPYGGGTMMCSGRFFAKQEIMVAAALLVLKFDIEPLNWVTLSGKQSDRPARPDENYAGAGVLPPDRDLMVNLRRRK